MFRRRLKVSFAVLAGVAVLQGVGLALALSEAHTHVKRGRVASDIQLGFVELSVAKQRLRAWVSQAQLDAGADPAQRESLFATLSSTLDRLRTLSQEAIALDQRQDRYVDEHRQRQEALQVLTRGFERLRESVREVKPLVPGADAREAWQNVARMFDMPDGRDLRRLIADNIARESLAVPRERRAADAALRRMQLLGTAAAGTLVLAALGLAAHFSRALRQPLDRLTEAARALQRGELEHRLPESAADEFATVARSVNAMAAELAEHRRREAQERLRLEDLVSARTKELEDALQTLQQVDARRRQLFADISHELRTPTTAIRGEAEITLRGRDRDSQEYKAALRRIVETTRQLATVIDDLLTMARSDIDALALDRRPLELSEPLRDAVATAQALGKEQDIGVDVELTGARLEVLGDAQRLRQVFMLVLDNAVRYSRPGGRVQVRLAHKPLTEHTALCELTIADRGIGIAPDDLPKIFQRNFRSEAARLHRADGTGLGLSIAAALLRAHAGEIGIASQPGVGTTVTIRLPLLQRALGNNLQRSVANEHLDC